MIRRIFVSVCIALCSVVTTKAQNIQKVKIADVVKLIDTSKSPLVVNFWATWCKPCVHELPYFERMADSLKSKGLKLILVSLDFKSDYPKNLIAFVKAQGYKSQILWLNETDANVFCPAISKEWEGTIPATIMVNNAKQYKRFYNQQITEPRLALELAALLQ